jgi:hypothetical protein
MEIFGVTSCNFRNRIDTRFFQEVGVLFAHAFDAEEVSEIDPFEDEALGDPGLFS